MAQRRKTSVHNNYLQIDPTPSDNQFVARVIAPRGSHLHQVEYPDGTITLAELPPRFRNVIWVKRDSYVIVQPFPVESSSKKKARKISAEITFVLLTEHITKLKQSGHFPLQWDTTSSIIPSSTFEIDTNKNNDEQEQVIMSSSNDDSDDSDDSIFRNPNGPCRAQDSELSSSDTE